MARPSVPGFAWLPLALFLAGAGTSRADSAPTPEASAQTTHGVSDSLAYISGSTVKLEQIIGDHDWADTARATASLTVTNADVLGNGLGYSFPSGDSLIFLFGDTIGASHQYFPRWASVLDSFPWSAGDPMASSRTTQPDSGLKLTFFKKTPDTTLTISPQYPDGRSLSMGGDEIANSGINLNSSIYLICNTGAAAAGTHDSDSCVVVQFNPASRTFTAGRTVSRAGRRGHFVFTALREMPMQFASSPTDSEVVIFGLGVRGKSDIYLSKIPKGEFWSGLTPQGKGATRYFKGIVAGQPTWTDTDSAAVPIVQDNPLAEIGVGLPQSPWPQDNPTINNLSVAWEPALGLWLLTFGGGHQSPPPTYLKQTDGIYFSYASTPWGPWSLPQLIFNATRDSALGTWIHTYNHNTNIGAGPPGPTIGNQKLNDPDTTSGANFAPQMIESFTRLSGNTLKIFYTLSTWNPYTVVKMRSKFQVLAGSQVGVQPPQPGNLPHLDVAPNPSSSSVRVSFSMARAGLADVHVYDVAGRQVRNLGHRNLAAGSHELVWDGRTESGALAGPGVYFVRVRSGGLTLASRMVRLR